jgi:CIC family chloride channel protein
MQTEAPSMATGRPGWPDPDAVSPAVMFLLALVVGVFAGSGSIVFRSVIALFQHLFFFGELGLELSPDIHLPPSTWGMGVILVPVVGAVIVTWITNTLAPEARGHGVPEVMNAIYYHGGRIRPITVVAKAFASAVSIGTGGSVGREGPIIQIGSAFGSTLGQLKPMPARQRIVLVGAGAAAGIAATFNAPLGGLAFAMELLLVSVSAQNVALVASATVTATWIGRLYSGIGPTFEIPDLDLFADHMIGSYQLLLCVPFGLIAGVAAAGFVRAIYWFEDWFEGAFDNSYLRHMAGMFVLGLMIYAFMQYTGEYYVNGVGYATIADILRDVLTNPLFLLLLFAAKLLATCLTLGSGASGGVFSPTLFLGASLGAAYADAFDYFIPSLGIDPVLFAIAGMAGMVGATTSAVVTAIIMIFEQTRDYSAILPIITTVALAYVVRVRLTPESIYTLKLARRGRGIPQGLQAAMSVTLDARKIMNRDFQVVELDRLREWEWQHRPGEGVRYTVVAQDGEILGIAREDLPYLIRDFDVEDLIDRNVPVVAPKTRWPTLMRTIKAHGCETLLVGSSRSVDDLRGIITTREIARAARDNAELMD